MVVTMNTSTRDAAREQQQRRLLAALQVGPVSTLEARELLNVIHPAGRIMELRELGYRIVTTWSQELDAWGRDHRVARYVLMQHTRGAGV